MGSGKFQIIVIGASAGGIQAIPPVLENLPEDFGIPIVICSHIFPSEETYFPDFLKSKTLLEVKEADEKEEIKPGVIYTSAPDYHLMIDYNKTFAFSVDRRVNFSRPSIDVLFFSAADVYGAGVTAVILSGANTDGTKGAVYIKERGGSVLVQSPQTALSPVMPQSVIDNCEVDDIQSPEQICENLMKPNKNKN